MPPIPPKPAAIVPEANEEERRLIAKIKASLHKGAENAFELGRMLEHARQTFAHGKWGAWVKANIPCSENRCNQYRRFFNLLVTNKVPEDDKEERHRLWQGVQNASKQSKGKAIVAPLGPLTRQEIIRFAKAIGNNMQSAGKWKQLKTAAFVAGIVKDQFDQAKEQVDAKYALLLEFAKLVDDEAAKGKTVGLDTARAFYRKKFKPSKADKEAQRKAAARAARSTQVAGQMNAIKAKKGKAITSGGASPAGSA